MNIFVVNENPIIAARQLCDKHVTKMTVESAQMLASACIRHGATPDMMPLTKSGKPYRGGYHNHPCTRWAGDSRANYNWLLIHGNELCREYTKRYGKIHACQSAISKMIGLRLLIPENEGLTPHPQCMPNEYKNTSPVQAYQDYYRTKSFAKWCRGTVEPEWFTIK